MVIHDWLLSDLEFALTLSIDWVALSFVQKPEDILELRALAGPKLKVSRGQSDSLKCFLLTIKLLLSCLRYD